ncbi:MAG: BamA/TamA family outer membrane protein [Epsilonproteobacteria bacterium]|nr:BamA/TamA family outer membrane protein [Campylobacterota bacterium]
MRFLYTLLLLAIPLFAQKLPVVFKGNRHISADRLYRAIGLDAPFFFEFWKGPPRYDTQKSFFIPTALESFYRSVGFYHARVQSEVQKERILVTVKEGEPVIVADISTISKLPVKDRIPLHPGERFQTALFTQSKKAVKALYADHHYCNVRLKAKAYIDIENNKAYLVYDVEPGAPCRFGRITIRPPRNVEPRIIRSLLSFKEGDPYSRELIYRSYREIYANEGVERVTIDDSQREGDTVPIIVTLSTYKKPLHLTAGVGYSTDEGISLRAGLKHRNFLGNLKTVALDLKYSQIRQLASLNAQMPLPHHNRLEGETGYRQERFDGYDERAWYATADLSHLRVPYYLRERIVYDHVETYNSTDPDLFPEGIIGIVSLGLTAQVDTRNSRLDPTRGYLLSLDAMGSIRSILSDATYYKLLGVGIWHLPIPGINLAWRGRAGTLDVADGEVPPSYRFYAGGMRSNRGWAYRQLGPKNRKGDPVGGFSIVESSLEWRRDLPHSLRGVLFVDATVLGQGASPDFGTVYTAVGIGFRYLSPIGPVGLDFGINIDDPSQYALHFHIGELF